MDVFQQIVSTLTKVGIIGLHDQEMNKGGIFVAGVGAMRAEKSRQDHRKLRLEAMKAVKQVLSSLHENFVVTPSSRKRSTVKNRENDLEKMQLLWIRVNNQVRMVVVASAAAVDLIQMQRMNLILIALQERIDNLLYRFTQNDRRRFLKKQ